MAILLALANAASAAITGSNWMASLDASVPLSRLSIPGTHNSGALYEPLAGTAKCQDLSIADQLNAGVRFLDIRCRHLTNRFVIHHGSVYQNLDFDDVLRAVIGFLNSNPTEGVMLSVKQEYTAQGNTRAFEATFDWYVARNPGKWLLAADIPTVEQARGKIVLFRRFSASSTPKGIDASSWPDDAAFTRGLLRVQDCYNVSRNDAKWTCITNLFQESASGSAGTLYVNFTSGVLRGYFGIPDIPGVANDINARLERYLSAGLMGRSGVVVMDFANAGRCALVYLNNGFPTNGIRKAVHARGGSASGLRPAAIDG